MCLKLSDRSLSVYSQLGHSDPEMLCCLYSALSYKNASSLKAGLFFSLNPILRQQFILETVQRYFPSNPPKLKLSFHKLLIRDTLCKIIGKVNHPSGDTTGLRWIWWNFDPYGPVMLRLYHSDKNAAHLPSLIHWGWTTSLTVLLSSRELGYLLMIIYTFKDTYHFEQLGKC